MHQDFKEYLKNRLKSDLPGFDSHLKMAPKYNNVPFRNFKPQLNTKTSAVLIILKYNGVKENSSILLTLRSERLTNHKGQISFPGGKSEQLENSNETALREANEEIGLIRDNVEIVGLLSKLYVPPSNSVITPVVAFLENDQEWEINPEEVQELFFVTLESLMNPDNLIVEDWTLDNKIVSVPFWNVHDSVPFWGATAMITNELLDIYNEYIND